MSFFLLYFVYDITSCFNDWCSDRLTEWSSTAAAPHTVFISLQPALFPAHQQIETSLRVRNNTAHPGSARAIYCALLVFRIASNYQRRIWNCKLPLRSSAKRQRNWIVKLKHVTSCHASISLHINWVSKPYHSALFWNTVEYSR